MANNYVLEGRQIFSDKGKLVATLNEDGNPVMAPGMAGPHSRGVKEFLQAKAAEKSAVVKENLTTENVDTPPQMPELPENQEQQEQADEQPQMPELPKKQEEEHLEEKADWEISTIPEDDLPPFSKELGCNTPGFMEYVREYKLTKPQVAALVKRMSK